MIKKINITIFFWRLLLGVSVCHYFCLFLGLLQLIKIRFRIIYSKYQINSKQQIFLHVSTSYHQCYQCWNTFRQFIRDAGHVLICFDENWVVSSHNLSQKFLFNVCINSFQTSLYSHSGTVDTQSIIILLFQVTFCNIINCMHYCIIF